jgi:SsrA-binding protein
VSTLSENRKARFDYTILDTFEAGIVLSGQVKSVKAGQISLNGSFVHIKNNEAFLTNAHVSPYKKAGKLEGYNPERDRKLLLNRKELVKIADRRQSEGLAIIPLSVFTTRGLVKIKIALARGKRKYEKRESIKKRETEKEIRKYTR